MHRFRSDESGQSLLLVVIAMSLIIALAAFGIDAATWMARHHQAQVVADSAALAAANCLANPGTTGSSIVINGTKTTVPACSSGTDTTSARTVAADYAAANGVTLTDPTSQVQFETASGHVSVSAAATSPSFFANLFGTKTTTQRAGAQATWVAGSTACSTPGNSCAAVFAMAQSCADGTGDPGGSPIIFNGKNDTITGSVHSNGTIYEGGGGGQTLGPTSFGNGSNCTIDTGGGSGDTWNGATVAPSVGQAPITTWPDDYTSVVTACGSGAGTCNSSGTPSYCTQSAANFTFGSGATTPTSGQVWCAYGTGTPSKPSTWNGLIFFQSGATSLTGNWIGGTVDVGSKGWTLSPNLSTFPVLYATGSGDCSSATVGGICMPGQNQTINGALFAPNGWIQFNGAGTTVTHDFLEGQYIDFIGGSQSILGSGPTSLTGSTAGTDSLTQ